MVVGKETQPIRTTPEQQALEEVQGYIEQVEQKVEVPQDVAHVLQQPAAQHDPLQQPIKDNNGQVVMQNATQPPIVLPLTQEKMQQGLHHQVVDSLRWLSEQCVMLIKKYPGRVFYNSSS